MASPEPDTTRRGTPVGTPALQQYGKFILVRKIAEGGMAEIFLAKQIGAEGFERNVVIKRMLPHLSQISDFVRMFLDEARLAAQLNHQNIVQINDLGFADGCYYICMEYLPGEDFSTLLRTASGRHQYVPSGVTARIVADAAHGLHYAHEFTDGSGRRLQIVHRDVSPSNIFVTYQGGVKVLDFGIVKAEARLTNTTAGVVKGKYMYMSPEQARSGEVDRRADIFSLGVSLYEALTNVRPFARDGDLAVLNAVLNGEFKRPRELRPDVSPDLERVVLRAMAVKVEERYQTAAEFAFDLEQFLNSGGASGAAQQVASYVQSLFGTERVTIRTRIPTLSTLAPSGFNVARMVELTPTEPGGAFAVDVDVTTPATGGNVTKVQRSTGKRRVAVSKASYPLRPLVMGLVVGSALAALGVLGYLKIFRPRQAKPVPPVVALAPPSATPLVTDPPLDPVQPSTTLVPAPTPPVAVASPVPPDAPPVSRRPTPVRPIELGLGDVQRVVSRERASVMSCFETHKADLPSAVGQVTVQFSIQSSGRVTGASARGPLAGTSVARCLEQRVTRLRFPVHRDKEVTLALPFEYRVER